MGFAELYPSYDDAPRSSVGWVERSEPHAVGARPDHPIANEFAPTGTAALGE